MTELSNTDAAVVPATNDVAESSYDLQTQNGKRYVTRGQVRLATPWGYAFASSNKDLPVVTDVGVKMTREDADKVMAEAADHDVFVFEQKEA